MFVGDLSLSLLEVSFILSGTSLQRAGSVPPFPLFRTVPIAYRPDLSSFPLDSQGISRSIAVPGSRKFSTREGRRRSGRPSERYLYWSLVSKHGPVNTVVPKVYSCLPFVL